jgi:hypothetical protein
VEDRREEFVARLGEGESMSDILSQVGITKEELIDRIVDKALGITADTRQTGEESWDDIPLSKVVDKKVEVAIGNLIETFTGHIKTRIDAIMDAKIELVFTTPIQRLDLWGSKIGEPVALRDMIYDEAKNYWLQKVRDNGEVIKQGDYNREGTERAVYFARKVMTDVYSKELTDTVKTMAEDLKNRIPKTIGDEITKTVLKHLN